MPEAGFAPTAAEAATQVPAATLDAKPEDVISRLKAKYQDSLGKLVAGTDLSRFVNFSRDELMREALDKVMGDRPLRDVIKNPYIRQPIIDEYHSLLLPYTNAKVQESMAGVVTSILNAAAKKIGNSMTPDKCINDPSRFLPWVDVLLRTALSKLGKFSAPTSIIFEIKDMDAPAHSVRTVLIWSDGPLDGMHKNMQLCIQRFPWIGRAALIIPEDASEEKKQEVLELRQLYFLAILCTAAEC